MITIAPRCKTSSPIENGIPTLTLETNGMIPIALDLKTMALDLKTNGRIPTSFS